MARRSARSQVKRLPVVGPAVRRAAAARAESDEPVPLDDGSGAARWYGDQYGYVFVVTYGRSGSTLLNGILNAIPGYLVRGENNGYLHHLYRAHRGAMTRRRAYRKAGQPTTATHPWYGIDGYPPQLALDAMRRLVVDTLLRPEPDTRVLGFKEIRYGQADIVEYLGFIRALFPTARFVFNTRDTEGVLASEWWTERDPEDFERAQSRMREAQAAHQDAACHVHYDDYRDDPEALRPLFAFLGETFDAEAIRRVIAVRHSY